MLQILSVDDSRLRPVDPADGRLPPHTVWIDLHQPTSAEEAFLEAVLGLSLPTKEDMQEIEPSSRLYREDGAMFMTASVVWKADTPQPENTPVTFVLAHELLVTIRYGDPRAFRSFAVHAERNHALCASAPEVLVNLLDAIIDRLADILERVGSDVDAIARLITRRGDEPHRRRVPTEALEEALSRMGANQDLTSKARDSLVSLSRLVSFLELPGAVRDVKDLRERVRSLRRDLASLTDHATFISGNISFLLNATLGVINVEQNAIIKIFSVAAVIFLPPTLVASVYGMNFHAMPELSWRFGYPWAIGVMITSALVPYLWFKRRGWL
ncbi:MAG TPA: magnesium transporter CorA family protein [Stellaceae bacterium]|nr:magnesium transporter CorA family protein [Stellaceae bacterium]